jgi:ribonuclease D
VSSNETSDLDEAWVTEPSQAAACAARLARLPRLAFDTEGDGMFRYRTRLCMMQFAGGSEVALVDTLAFDALPCFAELLGANGPEKIVHDASFDARVLFAHGVRLGRVFDTAVAARFLGLKATGLSSLLAAFFQIDLAKHKQQSDWGQRPLDAEALRYLADDVRHLEALADVLLSQVEAQGIEAEVREECAYVLSEAHTEVREVPPWTRLRGAVQRTPKERARLYELFGEREALARELDIPPGRFVNSEALSKLAERERAGQAELARYLSSRALQHSERFLSALARAEERADAPEHEILAQIPRPLSPAEVERKKLRKRRLTDFRTREAAERGVDPQVVLPGHCLNDLVDLAEVSVEALRTVPGFGLCRMERYAVRIVSELTPG